MTYARALGGGHHGHHGGGHHRGGRGFGGRRGWGPGHVDYYSYSPCDDCVGLPPLLYWHCLQYRGCVAPLYGVGQLNTPSTQAALTSMTSTATRTVMEIGAVGVVGVGLAGAGLVWWLKSRRKKNRS